MMSIKIQNIIKMYFILLMILFMLPAISLAALVDDFDGDLRSDILLWNSSNTNVRLWEINGTTIERNAFIAPAGSGWTFSHEGDFDDNGSIDILWTNTETNQFKVWLMDGGNLSAEATHANLPGYNLVEAKDFNGDGKTDLFWWDASTGNVRIWLMDGSTVVSNHYLGQMPISWAPTLFDDFDGDWRTDVLWYNATSGLYRTWLLNGGSVKDNAFTGAMPIAWQPVGSGLFNNGDGMADVLLYRADTGAVRIWAMNGATISQNKFIGLMPTSWSIEDVADFDGDLDSDILWTRADNDAKRIWLNENLSLQTNSFVGVFSSTDWVFQHISDYDANGKYDLLWRNQITSALRVWLMDGAAIAMNAFIGNPGSTDWWPQSDKDLNNQADIIPAAPTSPVISNVTSNSAILSWTDNSYNESGFQIGICSGLVLVGNGLLSCLSGFTQIALVNANVTSYTLTGLSANTQYSRFVRAYNSVGNSANTGISFTTATGQQTVTLQAIASNVVVANSLDSSWANTAYPNTYPMVGIRWLWSISGYPSNLASAGLVKFNISVLQGKTIDSAILNLEAHSVPVGFYPQNFQIAAIASFWSPLTVTWNMMSNFQFYTQSWQTFSYPIYVGQVYNINLTATVQNWANGTYANDGIAFQSQNYAYYPGNINSFDDYDFYTPTLTVTYH